jgi:hypothetical protein
MRIKMSGSYTLGTAGRWLQPNKSEKDPVPSNGKQLGNQILQFEVQMLSLNII